MRRAGGPGVAGGRGIAPPARARVGRVGRGSVVRAPLLWPFRLAPLRRPRGYRARSRWSVTGTTASPARSSSSSASAPRRRAASPAAASGSR